MSSAKRKTYAFHEQWETDFLFTNVNNKCVCLICGFSVAVGKRCNVQRHFVSVHGNFSHKFPTGSNLRKEKVMELKSALQRQQSLFTKTTKKGLCGHGGVIQSGTLTSKTQKALYRWSHREGGYDRGG
ncbi:unnamed protein product [Knipowitschia caucasica]